MKALKFLAIFAIVTACTSINEKVGLPDDHPMEEILEEAVEQKTGLSLDFSPSSPEHPCGDH